MTNQNLTTEQTNGPSTALFIGDLSFFCCEDDLVRLLSQFGTVVNAQIRKGKTGESLMHGFVEMLHPQQAMLAIQVLHNAKFMGRRLR